MFEERVTGKTTPCRILMGHGAIISNISAKAV